MAQKSARCAATAGALLTVAACALEPAPPAPTAPPVTQPPAADAPQPAPPDRQATLTPPAARPPVLPRPPPEPFPMQLDPGILIGLGPEQIEAMVGRASEVRDEPPATVWSYKSGDCTLEIFFYPEVETRKPRALAYAVGGKDQSDTAKQACFARIRTARRDRQN